MAMISLKNLVAPVSNSVHLASIFFVVLVFGVWRWSGGEVTFVRGTRSLNTHNSDKEASRTSYQKEVTRSARPAQAALPSRGVVEVPAQAADDLLGSMLQDNSNSRQPARAPTNNQQKTRPSNSLEDIERSLGIR